MHERARTASPARDFLGALRPGFAVIAEIKRASPAAGPISSDLDAAALARRYVAGGARAVSVWTDARYFNGDAAMVGQIRRAVPVPVLRKDFILDPYQVYESRAIGADAVLLIAALLQAPLLRGLIGLCSELGMAAAVDAHRAVDVDNAVEAGAQAIFIHNRDVGTFEVDIGKTLRFRRRIPKGILVVSESGIGTPADIARVRGHVDAVLVGTALMQSPDPEATVRSLLSTANSA